MLLMQATRREPSNEAARLKLQQARVMRSRRQPTVPSTAAEELSYNTFLRVDAETLGVLCGCCEEEQPIGTKKTQ